MLEFEWPWIFAVTPLPLLIRWLARPVSFEQAALRIPFIEDFTQDSGRGMRYARLHWLWLILATLAWLLLVAAAARPQWLGDPIELPVEGRDIMLAVDLSGSMEERDFLLGGRRVDRLTATKAVAGQFIDKRVGDRLGLILFGSRAYLQAPLTFDRQTVITLLNESITRIAGEKTAIGDAIGLAIKRLRKKQGDRILILLSDGENTAGQIEPVKAAELAAADGLKIYTIGIGPDARNRGSFFGMMLGSQRAGIDEKTLALIAHKTGGRYFHASNTAELAEVYARIDALEPIPSDSRVYRPSDVLFYWPLAGALLLGLIVMTGSTLRRELA